MKRLALYKRHKLLLILLKALGGSIRTTNFMKYLFLLSQEQEEASYYFIPSKSGCFSYQAEADKRSLIRRGMMVEIESLRLTEFGLSIVDELNTLNAPAVAKVKNRYSSLSEDDLTRFIRQHYPFYYLKTHENLSQSDQLSSDCQAICSIGYEGLSLDLYLLRLFKASIDILVDVRKSAFSMKYGFSKKTLKEAAATLGIEYNHVPALGIDGARRKKLKTQQDYDDLFIGYRRDLLRSKKQELKSLALLVNSGSRIAVTCYEANPAQCHRTIVAEEVSRLVGINVRNL